MDEERWYVHAFIQQVYTEYLLCASNSADWWGHKTDMIPAFK